jgi:hypothetical protein
MGSRAHGVKYGLETTLALDALLIKFAPEPLEVKAYLGLDAPISRRRRDAHAAEIEGPESSHALIEERGTEVADWRRKVGSVQKVLNLDGEGGVKAFLRARRCGRRP